ncbi:class I SAM-dependent methyltransferase [Glaciibacter sp. 2TAF33]|uniref:class I SAM-dependent methyltransferase n=1 Tax=Glaciibacter sp. 2TAF33 TaxID=3233015 RepID=UPI003F8E97CF
MPDARNRAHADSFQRGADGYHLHRPGYPGETVSWLLGGAVDVLDLGAGTGKLTAELVRRGATVTAVDPSDDMLRVLRSRLPQVTTLRGSAEQIPLADASVDLVTVAQAWHWVDAEAASAEVARVLRPGGRLALVWNSRDESVGWVDELSAAMHQGLHEAGRYRPTLGAGLVVTGQRADSWLHHTTRAGILALSTTRSYYLVAPPAEQQAMLGRIEAVLDRHAETSGTAVDLPYLTECWLAEPPVLA